MCAFSGHDTAHADKPAHMQSGKRARIRIQDALTGTSLLTNPLYMYTCIRINDSKTQSATPAQLKVHWHTPHNANEPIIVYTMVKMQATCLSVIKQAHNFTEIKLSLPAAY